MADEAQTRLIEVESIQRLDVKPGETLVVTLPEHTTNEDLEHIVNTFRERISDGVPLLFLVGEVRLSVLAKADVDA